MEGEVLSHSRRRQRASLEGDGRQVAERGMTPTRIVPALEMVEDREAGHRWGGEAVAIQQLALERREEALTEGIVVGIADRAHQGLHARLPAAQPKGDQGVLPKLNWSSQHCLCEPIVESHRVLRPGFASRESCAAWC